MNGELWKDVLARASGCDHIVQTYPDEGFLTDALAHYVGSGLRKGDGVVVVAVEPHWQPVSQSLAAAGLDPEDAMRRGQLAVVDAVAVLEQIRGDGGIDRARFEAACGGLIERVRRRGARVRVFGELVDLLWRSGERNAAMRLEEYWCDLQRAREFALFCAYFMDNLSERSYDGSLECVCKAHTHLIPVRDYDQLERAVQRAAGEVLEPPLANMMQTLASMYRPMTDMPLAQAILIWLKKNMPVTWSKILSRVRAYCSVPLA